MRYQFTGPGPVTDPEGTEIIRPGDVREFSELPPWGPWLCLDDGSEVPAVDLGALRAATADAPPVTPFTAPSDTMKEF